MTAVPNLGDGFGFVLESYVLEIDHTAGFVQENHPERAHMTPKPSRLVSGSRPNAQAS